MLHPVIFYQISFLTIAGAGIAQIMGANEKKHWSEGFRHRLHFCIKQAERNKICLKGEMHMCTAISVTAKGHYFGRNLDFHHGFGETVTITPRNFPFSFSDRHFAMIGTARVEDGYPLYFDATNEAGLSMAGLYFPGNAVYVPEQWGSVSSFELIPWILSQCASVEEAKIQMQSCLINEKAYRCDMPPSPLHWLIADKHGAITVEQTKAGLSVCDNPVGVLTNNPPFEMQMMRLSDYLGLSKETPKNRFAPDVVLEPYSRGMGAIGLPGDFSSVSRFVKACFVKENSMFGETEQEQVIQFFHILRAVEQPCGCVKVGDAYEKTIYTSCCNTETGTYYYTTYDNSTIRAVEMYEEELNCAQTISHQMNS